MRELTNDELNDVSGGTPTVVAGVATAAPWALAAVGAFGAGYALGTLIYRALK